MRQRIICWLLILSVTKAVLGQDVQGAMLYAKGTVWVNGKQLPGSSAVLTGDTVETEADSVGNISVPGSSIIVQQSSVVKFEVDSVNLQRGTVAVITTKSMRVRTGKVVATPTSSGQTDFEVSNNEGKAHIVVHKGQVEVNCGKQVTDLQEGQDITPDDQGQCKKGAYPARSKGPLANPWLWGGAAAAGGVIGIVIGISDKPASPSAPGP
jgi:ferric-dicitrate binding protein FerR (iron transport regulator)